MQRIGEIAAFGTAICWTLSAIFFERATKRVGVIAVNFYKVLFAFFFLGLSATLLRGMPLPLDAAPSAWLYLSLSGIIGFVITDIFLFTAYKTIGSRMAMLFLAASPPITGLLGYIFLGEAMGTKSILGMAIVATGIMMAVLGRRDVKSVAKEVNKAALISKEDKRGYVFAALSAIGQSIGMIFTKHGLGDYDPISGTQIRVISAIVGFTVVSFFWDRGKSIKAAPKDPVGMKLTVAGAIAGPFLGVALSLFAMQRTFAGIVSTLIGLTPALIIPPSIIFFKQKVRALEIIGALIAVAGSAVFFL
jgi:drug/metabolite transporter (DMT)-like permease